MSSRWCQELSFFLPLILMLALLSRQEVLPASAEGQRAPCCCGVLSTADTHSGSVQHCCPHAHQ